MFLAVKTESDFAPRPLPRLRFILAFLLLAAAGGRALAADSVSIAAAANLVYALDALDGEFARANPGVALKTTVGASGSLVAQISNGAPFDVFLSADLDFPKKLIKSGHAEPESFRTFAIGRLVLWTTKPGIEIPSIESVVRNPAISRIAIANPETAPYGTAAEQALEKLGLLAEARPKLVRGETISQTAQFVETGNADAGFVALSLVLSPKLKDRGRWLEVPAALYGSLEQGAVLTSEGKNNPAARRYLEFLGSPEARAVLKRFGYGLPR